MKQQITTSLIFRRPFLLSIISGLLLFGAWPMSTFTFLIFIAFIPLLHLSNVIEKKWKYFFLLYLSLFIWNVSTTWWIYYATGIGAIGAFVVNSLLMCIPWHLYRRMKRKFSATVSYIALIAFWLAFEFGHLHDWGLSWPWLTVGNVFADKPGWIQWYSATGTSGGTLWVFIVNIFIYEIIKNINNAKQVKTKASYLALLLLIPFFISFLINWESKAPQKVLKSYRVVVAQPNIDPWIKLETLSPESQIEILINNSKTKLDSTTELLIWPETALFKRPSYLENNLKASIELDTIWKFLKQYPKLKLLTGIESIKIFDAPTENGIAIENSGKYYEAYNGATILDSAGAKQFYHKSLLVPGAETLPWFLKFLAPVFDKFGGTTNGYTRNVGRTPMKVNDYFTAAPSICYESIYGGFMSKYQKNGANLITIITNDGWWRNTPGHKQHFAYAKLRAVENRCYVARSANTGISGFIDPYGNEIETLGYDKNGAVKASILPSNASTFYNQYPDIIYWLGVIFTIIFIVYFFYKKLS